LRAAGFELTGRADGRLVVRWSRRRLTDAERLAVRALSDQVLAHLRSEAECGPNVEKGKAPARVAAGEAGASATRNG
jgi:hypothetical protein